ncbi:MAG: family 43 glycosylhydrolase [Dysgonamonadaceae bacterium]|jgi:arabinan endo-1,5-alpha-L-arabinosidase|nr:family 43 glycosylhydrolase [Dysgonamonadaceae bacterium]
MKTDIFTTFFLITMFFTACGKRPTVTENYQNPLMRVSTPDPSILRDSDGYFYLYATEDIRNTPVFRSKNLVEWEQIGTCFTDETRPKWGTAEAGIWAPDINKIDGKYVLYYTFAAPYCRGTCGIGVAIADSPTGPFTDIGPIIQADSIGVLNSIDQCYVEDNGKKYIIWGSFEGIYAIELTDNGLAIKPGAEKVKVAGGGYEASNILKRDGYYYYFASIEGCCAGAESTYKVVVGKADNLFGPYITRDGESMMGYRPSVILRGDTTFAGPGHNAEIVTDDEGQDWLLYHAFLKKEPHLGRLLCLDRLVWNNGYPEVATQTPSQTAKAPVFLHHN